ncbi:MAG TPA: SRPBCC family protein [Dehalococcoidia bacterium]|nr:SRPBCC family protein [Dehalococcoidia bacterium]
MKFSSSTDINAPSETIWAAVNDPEGWSQWVPSIKKVERVSKGPLGVGAQVRVTAKAGITVKLLMTITEFVPKQRVIMEGKILGTKLIRSYTLKPLNHKTRFTASGEVSGPSAWLIRRGGQALSDEIVQALKKKIEG